MGFLWSEILHGVGGFKLAYADERYGNAGDPHGHQVRLRPLAYSHSQFLDIPEPFHDNFLDILLVRAAALPGPFARVTTGTTPAAVNPVIEISRRIFIENGAPSYNSAILDAFNNLSTHALSPDVTGYLSKSWIEDLELTLRLKWTLGSILKNHFIRAFMSSYTVLCFYIRILLLKQGVCQWLVV